jgi:hypothetical protein
MENNNHLHNSTPSDASDEIPIVATGSENVDNPILTPPAAPDFEADGLPASLHELMKTAMESMLSILEYVAAAQARLMTRSYADHMSAQRHSL